MNIIEESVVDIANSLKSISESLAIIASQTKQQIKESKRKSISRTMLNESQQSKKLKSPKEAVDEILRKEIFE